MCDMKKEWHTDERMMSQWRFWEPWELRHCKHSLGYKLIFTILLHTWLSPISTITFSLHFNPIWIECSDSNVCVFSLSFRFWRELLKILKLLCVYFIYRLIENIPFYKLILWIWMEWVLFSLRNDIHLIQYHDNNNADWNVSICEYAKWSLCICVFRSFDFDNAIKKTFRIYLRIHWDYRIKAA